MPSRNILKIDASQSYYHIYARGSNKQTLFLEPADFYYFEKLFARYLSNKPSISKEGAPYPHLRHSIDLLAYCCMGNHFHLLIFQKDRGSMTRFMRSLMTSYSRYFNLKYKKSGPVFESRYRASLVAQEDYLLHISRYIHLNPRYWRNYPYSSLKFYRQEPPEWLSPSSVLSLFTSLEEYMGFLADYEEHKAMLEELKGTLAN